MQVIRRADDINMLVIIVYTKGKHKLIEQDEKSFEDSIEAVVWEFSDI